MPHSSTAVLSAGVDTLTCSTEWEGGIHSFISLAQYLLRDDAAHGSKTYHFKRGAYKGVGTRNVGLAFAPGRVLAELRGPVAHEFWPHFLDRATRVSRLDVEVSVRQQPYDHDMALRLYLGERERARQRGRPSTFRMQGESDGGTTLYIGTGASRYQARLYERYFKTHQKADREVWRYEVQTRRERAQQVADILRSHDSPCDFATGAVWSHFTRRGVAPIFSPGMVVNTAPLPDTQTDKDKSLRWLASAVRPALSRHDGWGSRAQALKALGIDQDSAAQLHAD